VVLSPINERREVPVKTTSKLLITAGAIALGSAVPAAAQNAADPGATTTTTTYPAPDRDNDDDHGKWGLAGLLGLLGLLGLKRRDREDDRDYKRTTTGTGTGTSSRP
jgi:MYXO-CTERM domain-containing protein